MNDWRELVKQKRFAEAVSVVEAEYEARDAMGNQIEDRAWFYEQWGDYENDAAKKRSLYEISLDGFQFSASGSSSGGEGTARMREVERVREKLEALNENNV